MSALGQSSTKRIKKDLKIENINITEEVTNNEEILFELDECLRSKDSTIQDLKDKITNLEGDIKRYTTSYDPQNSSLENDIIIFRTVASKYVKKDLIDFYIERMQKSASNKIDKKFPTIEALCFFLLKNKK